MPTTVYEATIPFSIQGQALAVGDQTTLEDQAAKWHLLDDRFSVVQVFTTAGIEGFAFDDTNSDGLFTAGEPGVQGVELTVTDSASVSTLVVTDIAGNWSLEGLPAGSTTVAFNGEPTGFFVGNLLGNYPYTVVLTVGPNHVAPALDMVQDVGQ